MTFGPETVVADAIKQDPGVIGRLVALNPTFRKLRNPVLRKVMARLVSFRDAARVAGVPLDTILAAANGDAAPESTKPGRQSDSLPPPAEDIPEWLSELDEARAERVEVRPLLDAGEEPLGLVMRIAAKVGEGEFLTLDAPFDPAPLRRVLRRKGFVSYAERLGEDHWRVIFQRNARRAETESGADRGEDLPSSGSTEGAIVWREGSNTHVDVRGLEPPRPLRAIISLIEADTAGGPIIVHHEREPVFLYPELAERGWVHAIIDGDAGEVRLRLERTSGS